MAIGTSKKFDDVTAQTGSVAMIDFDYLKTHTFGNATLEVEMLELFLRQSTRLLLEFNDTTSAKDWRDYARALKGSAQSVGAMQVAGIASKIEACSRLKDRDEAVMLVDALQDAIFGVNDKIRAHLKNLAPVH